MESGAFRDIGVELSLELCGEDGDHLRAGDGVAAGGPEVQGAVEVGECLPAA